MWNAHSPSGVAWHVMSLLSGHRIVHVVPWKLTVHPACVNGDTPTRLVPNVGKRWTLRAAGGMFGMVSSAVGVEWMVWLFATLTATGCLVGWRCGSCVAVEK